MFQNSVVEERWERTSGKCMVCGKKLSWKNRGKKGSKGAWKVGPIRNFDPKKYVLSNCEIDCFYCYRIIRL